MQAQKPLFERKTNCSGSQHARAYACDPAVPAVSRESATLAPLVAHIIYRLDVGGLENGLVNLINHMPSDRYRHAIVCLTEATDFQRRLRNPRIPIYELHKPSGKGFVTYLELYRLLRVLRPALVHTRNLGTLDAVIPAALSGVRHRVHGEHGWDTIDLHGASRKYRLLRNCCSPLINQYVTVSRDLAGWLESRVGISRRKVTHIYNGVDTTRFEPSPGRAALPPGFATPDSVVIGSVGRMQEVKDPLTLVRAFLELLRRTPDRARHLRLVMVGDGPLRAEALTLLGSAGANDVAWLPGSRDDVAELLRAFDVFVLPSLNEGISNTILEAMATGLPVVATHVGGNPELVDDGRSGILVAPSDPGIMSRALQQYVESSELRCKHGQAGLRRVQQDFNLDSMVDGYQKLYDAVLGREPSAMPRPESGKL